MDLEERSSGPALTRANVRRFDRNNFSAELAGSDDFRP